MTSERWRSQVRSLLSGRASAQLPPDMAEQWLEAMEERGWPTSCTRGHRWTAQTARVRVRDRSDCGKGLTVERSCLACEAQRRSSSRRKRPALVDPAIRVRIPGGGPATAQDQVLMALEAGIRTSTGLRNSCGLEASALQYATHRLRERGLVEGYAGDGSIALTRAGRHHVATHTPTPRGRVRPPRSQLAAAVIAAGCQDRALLSDVMGRPSYGYMTFLRRRGVSQAGRGETSVDIEAVADLVCWFGWPEGLPDGLDLTALEEVVERKLTASRRAREAMRVRAETLRVEAERERERQHLEVQAAADARAAAVRENWSRLAEETHRERGAAGTKRPRRPAPSRKTSGVAARVPAKATAIKPAKAPVRLGPLPCRKRLLPTEGWAAA
ncbi:hypothetical protein [Actinomyces urogenitalis]|uniref:hypothetical protein n=1 Tax=Actinomyces urogenitalis TaxID=103621 RepID=UPI001898BD5E|nr:hypothetical protein [Actinomyces urogenitalis]